MVEVEQQWKPRQMHCVPCNLTEISEHVLQVMQAQCAEANIMIHHAYAPTPLIQVDVAQMEQVLFNLYINALQAMPDGGVLTVSCQIVSVDHRRHAPMNVQREQGTAFAVSSPMYGRPLLLSTLAPTDAYSEGNLSTRGEISGYSSGSYGRLINIPSN